MNFTVTTIVLELMIFHYNLGRKGLSTYDWILEKRRRSEIEEGEEVKGKDLKEKTKEGLKEVRRGLEEPTVSRLRVIFRFCKYFKSPEHLELNLTTGNGKGGIDGDPKGCGDFTGVLVGADQNTNASPGQKNDRCYRSDVSNMMSDKSQIDMSVENSLNDYCIERDLNSIYGGGSKGELYRKRNSTDDFMGMNSFDVNSDQEGPALVIQGLSSVDGNLISADFRDRGKAGNREEGKVE